MPMQLATSQVNSASHQMSNAVSNSLLSFSQVNLMVHGGGPPRGHHGHHRPEHHGPHDSHEDEDDEEPEEDDGDDHGHGHGHGHGPGGVHLHVHVDGMGMRGRDPMHTVPFAPPEGEPTFCRHYFQMHLSENIWISIKISLTFVPKGPIDHKSALVEVMAWHWTGDKPLPGTMMTRFNDFPQIFASID